MGAAPVFAQSLGDVARQEEARRATAKKATKSFSNADLSPAEVTSQSNAAPGEGCYMSRSQGRCVTAAELLANSASTTGGADTAKEADWRQRAETIRKQIAKAQSELDAVSATPSAQSRQGGERGAASRLEELQRSALKGAERQWEKLEKAAEREGVPAEWLYPKPILSPRIPQ